MGGFLAGLFGGQDKSLDSNITNFGQEGTFAQGQGEGDITDATSFYKDILSGDPSQVAQALAPEISAQQQQGQQQKNQIAQFGNRSGGNNAAVQGIDTANRGNLINLEGNLKNSAAGALGSLGTTEQGFGLQAQQAQDQASQQRLKNWQDSILGGAITGAVGTGLEALEGGIPGIGGGGGTPSLPGVAGLQQAGGSFGTMSDDELGIDQGFQPQALTPAPYYADI
jgi:hypothetical protein